MLIGFTLSRYPLKKAHFSINGGNALLKKHPGQSGFKLLGNNLDAFTARIATIRVAEKTIDAQYYTVEDELTGKLFLKNLLDAADRGVRVRLLMDDLKTAGRDAFFAALDSHKNMEVRAFNPFSNRHFPYLGFMSEFKRLDRRMHNKSLTIDNILTIMGGRNIGDQYFSASSDLEFGDLDIVGFGPVSQQVSSVFDQYWNDPYSYAYQNLHSSRQSGAELQQVRNQLTLFSERHKNHVYVRHIRHSQLSNSIRKGTLTLEWGKAQVFADQPRITRQSRKDNRYTLAPKVRAIADRSSHEIIIISPYFIPKDWGGEVFPAWKKRGISTNILTNSLASNDVPAVHSGYSSYRKGLLRLGVKIYELKPNVSTGEGGVKSKTSGLHAKSFVFDRNSLFVGSMNLDPRSVVLNTEMGVWVHNKVLATKLAKSFEKNIEKIAYQLKLEKNQFGSEQLVWLDNTPEGVVRYFNEPKTSWLKRFGTDLLRILPIKQEL